MRVKEFRLPVLLRAFRARGFLIVLGAALALTGCQSFNSGHDRGVYHYVLKGQTLYAIASAYGMNSETLARVNGMKNPDHLQAGRRLWIPNAIRVMQVPITADKSIKQKILGWYKKRFPEVARKPEPTRPRQHPPTAKKTPGGKHDFIWPVKGGILTSRYGIRNGRKHEGIDIGAKTGTPIRAASGGTVMFSGPGPTGYGLMVIVKHSENLMTVYSHNSKNYVRKNMKVKQGQMLAAVGSTGRSTGPHLHFEVRNDARPMDPLSYLPKTSTAERLSSASNSTPQTGLSSGGLPNI